MLMGGAQILDRYAVFAPLASTTYTCIYIHYIYTLYMFISICCRYDDHNNAFLGVVAEGDSFIMAQYGLPWHMLCAPVLFCRNVTCVLQILAEGHDVFPHAPAAAHGRSGNNAQTKPKKNGLSATFTSRAAGLALTAQGMLLIARLAKLMVAFAFVRGGTKGKMAAWDQRQEELMSWFKVRLWRWRS
jgi:hypothetical protein